jgi:hypothetical protein
MLAGAGLIRDRAGKRAFNYTVISQYQVKVFGQKHRRTVGSIIFIMKLLAHMYGVCSSYCKKAYLLDLADHRLDVAHR